jgi:hypothetical protein
MLNDPIYIANTVADWTGLGINLSPEMTKAVEVFDAIKYSEVGHAPIFDLEKVTPKNAEAEIRKLADQFALSTVHRDGAGNFSALDLAKRHALHTAARKVIQLAAAFVPEVINQLSPEFDRAVAEFGDAVQALPDDLSDAAIVQAGPAVLAEYQRAAQAQGVIAGLDNWIASLRELPGFGAAEPDPITRVLRPSNRPQLSKLGSAGGKRYGQLNPLYVVAVREGVRFGLNTPSEAAAIRAHIQASPVQDKPIRVA